ncbi:c-type cytochrome [Phenylobacterium sp.]|jgi:cytochrome c oxidase cbb3-type subunit 3|uniref:c-type cytochrome n=1 Tax=Phenylobacterium sp. TaxID=1871053 RepID=UPI002E37ABE1|nr:c-type cytochrome [Phenylobacterium sp.]HEX3365692.1 c-type cytochrome [Phenylobacterium sp.]
MFPRLALAVLAALSLAACGRTRGDSTTGPAVAQVPTDQTLNAIPLGAPPGEPVSLASRIASPFAGNAQAIAEGKQLFSSMNCVYCHGAQASGLMGPPLNGVGWRYGGTPAELYNSVHDGRPQGMPAWGGRLPPDQIWKLVAYLQTLGDASGQPSTTGAQAAEQDASDSAHQGLIAAQKAR